MTCQLQSRVRFGRLGSNCALAVRISLKSRSIMSLDYPIFYSSPFSLLPYIYFFIEIADQAGTESYAAE